MNWNGDEWLEGLYREALLRHKQLAETETWQERKSRLKSALLESIGTFEPSLASNPKILERVECDGYIRERVELSATPGLTFAAYVLMPSHASGPLPGVLALHGHGYGSREIVGLKPDGTPDDGVPGSHGHFAVQLAKKGMAVIAPDIIGYGERKLLSDLRQDPNAPNSCYTLSTTLMMLGKTLTGIRVCEALAAFSYLEGRPEVDGQRVGAMGFSGGALIAYVAAALNERIQATLLTGFTNTFKDSILAMRHCIDNYTPGLLRHAELPELIGLIAPRPLFLESGERDRLFPVDSFRAAAAAIEGIYKKEGAQNKLAFDVFPGIHEVSGRHSFDWLKEQLSGPQA
ncbi:dienelactone hydrolase family protein [Paenibacillus soyae]|uniref:Alpha/beta hydrolase family protein n=1 Tax=Paenibacillus soyae TaxID=2969249 RepID=A0A9X2MP43_9BACL|nr:alpha/beta hydrolase family protein [Paenibacillus soyae]MCR2803850.1 alpha/beta hydrolase family protein [Paenibacillus soyae]